MFKFCIALFFTITSFGSVPASALLILRRGDESNRFGNNKMPNVVSNDNPPIAHDCDVSPSNPPVPTPTPTTSILVTKPTVTQTPSAVPVTQSTKSTQASSTSAPITQSTVTPIPPTSIPVTQPTTGTKSTQTPSISIPVTQPTVTQVPSTSIPVTIATQTPTSIPVIQPTVPIATQIPSTSVPVTQPTQVPITTNAPIPTSSPTGCTNETCPRGQCDPTGTRCVELSYFNQTCNPNLGLVDFAQCATPFVCTNSGTCQLPTNPVCGDSECLCKVLPDDTGLCVRASKVGEQCNPSAGFVDNAICASNLSCVIPRDVPVQYNSNFPNTQLPIVPLPSCQELNVISV